MKNLGTKKLNREQMRSVLGGYADIPHCSSDEQCGKGYYCDDSAGSMKGGYCVKKPVEPPTTTSSKILLK